MKMLNGTNVYLRPIIKEDLEFLNRWKNDNEVYEYLGGGYSPVSVNQHEQWLNNLIEITDKNKRFMICTHKKPIGMIGLYDINWVHRFCEIGMFIGEKDLYGKGYASEAYYLLEDYIKNYLNLRKIKLMVVEENTAAYNLWIKLDFEKIGKFREERFIKGEYCDVVLMEKFINE